MSSFLSRTPSIHEGVFIEGLVSNINEFNKEGGTLQEALDGVLVAAVGLMVDEQSIEAALNAVIAAAEINGLDLNIHIETQKQSEAVH